jgi:hypothetical protein
MLVSRFRAWSADRFGLPNGEDLRVAMVRDQPWSAYNWYEGSLRSRVDVNLALPARLPALVRTVAHEAYPGHHLEHASKERRLVDELGRLEASILLINTPECLVSEGLANAGARLIVPPADLPDLLVELGPLAGVELASDAGRLAAAAVRWPALAAARGSLDEARVNAALRLHEDHEPRDRVRDYLVEVGRLRPAVASKRLEFIDHPLWRLYVHVYPDGEALVRRWLEAVPAAERATRFGRLLRESLTPVMLTHGAAAGA